ncbi:ComEC/Rec2 family competence protein [Lusitaniella coriacea LEGE 07157]|uniref:ComEC/Rec2 family competence protein n=1 Tax=Lusitaniella coriacea LEGE 07157 TaxID=945747 RepID=A0A8J7DYE2_9CYAN|nr:ComEC/Rec2 family competence protein [Lusitaniella coriacea]MBE9117646.1 ComEC/Rec2 family competence protein [Lusitaniella coriacea LEGE 07157]
MNATRWVILCCAYGASLLSTAILGFPTRSVSWQQWGGLALSWAILGVVAGFVVPRFWRMSPRLPIWIAAGLVGALAVSHLQLRVPQMARNDLSLLVPQLEGLATVRGQILNMPTLNRKQNVRFLLAAETVNDRAISGKVYVTVPLLQGTGLVPRQGITIRGILYQPKPAAHPGAFDFQGFLARQGVFSGLKGYSVESLTEAPWGWWQIRSRIIRAQVRWLGSPTGQLVSSIVLGRRAVDLPDDIREAFIQAGLAHVLAASGFHVSLLLGVILVLTRNLAGGTRLWIGMVALSIYVGLTGVQASVMRAVIMGCGALVGLATERKVKPLGLLLLAATLLLLCNPLWIWDLGFQLSFLATLGLMVTTPRIVEKLDWLPPTIATLIAVPLAASLWTLPLLLYVFNTVATYSIPINILTTPLISAISLGGMVSALVALIFPLAGSAIAWLLYYPAQILIAIVQFFTHLPGHSWAVGKIELWQLFLVYGAIFLIWQLKHVRRYWGGILLFCILLIIAPIYYNHLTRVQITVLPTQPLPAIVLEDRGKVSLINSGDEDTVRYTVLPFLRNRGINSLHFAIDPQYDLQQGWSSIFEDLSVKTFFAIPEREKSGIKDTKGAKYQPLKAGQTIKLGSALTLKVMHTSPSVFQLKTQEGQWLLVDWQVPQPQNPNPTIQSVPIAQSEILLWSGETLKPEWLKTIQPKVVITTSEKTVPDPQKQIQLYATERDGSVQWQLGKGFEANIETTDLNNSIL